MLLRRALGPIVVFAAAALGCGGTADSTSPDAASSSGRDSAAQSWPGTGDDSGAADSQDGDATSRDEATVGPAAPADAHEDAPVGATCSATICPSGEICCEEPAPTTGYCTPQCVVGPGCPVPACKIPPDGGTVLDASSADGGFRFEAGSGDAAAADGGPLTCSALSCPKLEACCMELVMGVCKPTCVPSGLPCLVCE